MSQIFGNDINTALQNLARRESLTSIPVGTWPHQLGVIEALAELDWHETHRSSDGVMVTGVAADTRIPHRTLALSLTVQVSHFDEGTMSFRDEDIVAYDVLEVRRH